VPLDKEVDTEVSDFKNNTRQEIILSPRCIFLFSRTTVKGEHSVGINLHLSDLP